MRRPLGSKADIEAPQWHVRSTPKSGHEWPTIFVHMVLSRFSGHLRIRCDEIR
jgi:hypothetical protein